jgi:hypothetical protein
VALDAGDITSCYDPDGALSPCKKFCTPDFANADWQYWFDQFVLAMGRHLDNNPEFSNLSWVGIATGADGETNERVDRDGCTYQVGNRPAFDDWVLHVMDVYNRAFPHTPQFLQSTLHGLHVHAARAASYPSQLTGVKANGLEVDVSSSEVRWDGVLVGGVTGFSAVWSPLIATGFEPKHGNGVEGSYWFFMEGLAAHPYLFDVQIPNIRDAYFAEQWTRFPLLDFVRTHLGKTIYDTPDVWIVLRETQHSDVFWYGSDGVLHQHGPHHGDLEYWLYRRDSFPGSKTVTLFPSRTPNELPVQARNHPYSWQSARRTDQATNNPYMSFTIDNSYPYLNQTPRSAGGTLSWRVSVTFVNQGADTLALEYMDDSGKLVERKLRKGSTLGTAGGWVDYTWQVDDTSFRNVLPGGADFRLSCRNDGDEIVHRLIVSAQNSPPASAPSAR